jgi:hypothetical protein
MTSPGDLVLRDERPGLRVLQADPKILIGGEVLEELRAGRHHPDVTLDGDVLTINGINRKVIYRIGEQRDGDFQRDQFPAEWPD